MIIKINDAHQINFDGSNYMPEFFKAGGEEVNVAGRELVTVDKWQPYGKFFTSLDQCLRFLARQSACESDSELDLSEYIGRVESALKSFSVLARGQ